MKRSPFIAGLAVAAMLLASLAAAQAQVEEPVEPSGPAIILGPPPDAENAERPPPPIARKKPERKQVTTPPKAAEKKAPAKKAAAKKAPPKKAAKPAAKQAPARAAVSAPSQAKDCDYCYGCESMVATCRRQWVCGRKYTERLAAGLCRR